MIDILRREFIYLWFYFSVQLEQIFPYWVLGMVLGSLISVFGKGRISALFLKLQEKKLGIIGLVPASLLGIASPICMYGTIPLAASFSQKGMRHDFLAAFMMSSMLLNPQLLIYSAALGETALWVRFFTCLLCGITAGVLVRLFFKNKPFFNFKNFGESAAAFMLTGPATKITNLGAVKIVLGIKRFTMYIAYVIVFSLITGMIVDLIL